MSCLPDKVVRRTLTRIPIDLKTITKHRQRQRSESARIQRCGPENKFAIVPPVHRPAFTLRPGGAGQDRSGWFSKAGAQRVAEKRLDDEESRISRPRKRCSELSEIVVDNRRRKYRRQSLRKTKDVSSTERYSTITDTDLNVRSPPSWIRTRMSLG